MREKKNVYIINKHSGALLFSTKLSNGLHVTERETFFFYKIISKWIITSIKADN